MSRSPKNQHTHETPPKGKNKNLKGTKTFANYGRTGANRPQATHKLYIYTV